VEFSRFSFRLILTLQKVKCVESGESGEWQDRRVEKSVNFTRVEEMKSSLFIAQKEIKRNQH
jgi:hypothetical protein